MDSRLCNIEAILGVINDKLAGLVSKPPGLDGPTGKCDLHMRVERMEMLLFRTSLEDFASLDSEIKEIMPQVKAVHPTDMQCMKSVGTSSVGSTQLDPVEEQSLMSNTLDEYGVNSYISANNEFYNINTVSIAVQTEIEESPTCRLAEVPNVLAGPRDMNVKQSTEKDQQSSLEDQQGAKDVKQDVENDLISKFGYSIGDVVGWQWRDGDVPVGSQGKVTSFEEDAVAVMFTSGEFLFPPSVLYRFGEEVDGYRFGDSVSWTTEDAHARKGSVGIVIGAKDGMLLVDFGNRQYFLEAAELLGIT
jgi:hypothetical protein